MTQDKKEISTSYLDLLNFKEPEQAYKGIQQLVSGLSEKDHLIRSCIFDIHASVELELRRIVYHALKHMRFLTDDEKQSKKAELDFERMVDKLGFMDMYRILWPILKHWPYPDFDSIEEINKTRNQAAHNTDMSKVSYKSRNPFLDADCLAQICFDAWAIRQCMVKFYNQAVERPFWRLQKYYEKYGEI